MNFSDDENKNFVNFLSDILKDKSYVEFAYMTGILPIAKYFSTSFCNMFPNEHNSLMIESMVNILVLQIKK
jgi:hypothetical protein